MTKRGGMWAELQRELARRQRLEQQRLRTTEQAAKRAAREHDQAVRAAARQAAADQREQKRLYIEDRKAETASMVSELQARIAELDSVLVAGIRNRPMLTFASLRQVVKYPPFDAGGLDRAIPEPCWEQFAPPPPSGLSRMFGGSGRHERQEAAARAAYEQARAQHAAAEAQRLHQLADRRRRYDIEAGRVANSVAEHNAGIDQFEQGFLGRDPEAVAGFCTLVLDSSAYPEGFVHRTRALYRPEPREVVVEYELPPQSVIPVERDFRYVQTRDEIVSVNRPDKDLKDRYARLIAQVALRTIHETMVGTGDSVTNMVTFNGHVSTKDLATGQPIRPCLISVSAPRELFSTFVLADLDPVTCLRKLNALVSNHPYDLEAVRPVVDFEALLSQYKFVEGMDAVAGLDSRPDLLDMTPTEFEHLVRQLFEAMGMKSWVTQASKDDGVDAVAVNEDPVFGGLCIVQAKRYRSAVGVEPVRALAGVMEDKHATKGIMVTTSWVTKDGHDFANRHGRIEVVECEQIKYLCKEHLGLDVLISLPKPPPQRRRLQLVAAAGGVRYRRWVPAVLCLLASPLVAPAVWHTVADLLRADGWQVAETSQAGMAPTSFEDALASFLDSVPANRDVILVPHSNAGLYVPALTTRRRVVGYVFVDAVLPPPSGEAPMIPPDLYEFLAGKADADGVLPGWTQWWDEDISSLFPDAEVQAKIERAEPLLPLSYFGGTVSIPTGWDKRPGAYLSFGDTYAPERTDATSRGWPTRTIKGEHLHMLVNPAQVTAELINLLMTVLNR